MQTVDTTAFNAFVDAVLADSGAPVVCEIVTNDPKVQKYWPLLEFGSAEGHRPWPEPHERTMYGQIARVVSTQAPQGFIRKNARQIYQYLADAYMKKLQQVKRPLRHAELVDCANQAGQKALALYRVSIPVKSGRAKNSLAMNPAK